MAKPKAGTSGAGNAYKPSMDRQKKKTSIGHSKNTRLKSKNDKRHKKLYRGQGK